VDEDLVRMTREELIAHVKKLRDGIRGHRDSDRHELCWHHPALWGLLPEKTDPLPTVPDWPQFIRGCVKYRESLEVQAPQAPRTWQAFEDRARVARVWQGRTREAIADTYARYLHEEGVKKLRATKGNLGVQVFRETRDGVAQFTTISYWASREDIKAYAGEHIERPHHLHKDAEYLLELPQYVRHFDILVNDWGVSTQA
jgi:heme-degrading monooxygenase HmoA